MELTCYLIKTTVPECSRSLLCIIIALIIAIRYLSEGLESGYGYPVCMGTYSTELASQLDIFSYRETLESLGRNQSGNAEDAVSMGSTSWVSGPSGFNADLPS